MVNGKDPSLPDKALYTAAYVRVVPSGFRFNFRCEVYHAACQKASCVLLTVVIKQNKHKERGGVSPPVLGVNVLRCEPAG